MIDKGRKKDVINDLTLLRKQNGRLTTSDRQNIAEFYNVGMTTIYRWEKQLDKEQKTNGGMERVIERLEAICTRLEQTISIWEMERTK